MIRLFVEAPLATGARVELAQDQAHYLTRVMRLGQGDALALFNGVDGEWRASLQEVGRRGCRLAAHERLRSQRGSPDVELIFPPIRRARLETLVEKACELGAGAIRLVLTERTQGEGPRLDRLRAIAIEAAEQCGRLDVPVLHPPVRLGALLAAWPADRRLMVCDESGKAPPVAAALSAAPPGGWSLLIGPEGGLTPAEREALRALEAATLVDLGPRILRAETAAIAALALWQALVGDGRGA